MIPPKTKRTLDHFCKNTVISYLFPVRPGRGRDPRARRPQAEAQRGGVVAGRGPRARRECSAGGRRAVGRRCATRHTAHDRAARRTTVDGRRLGRRARRTADSPSPNAPASGIPRPRPGTAQPRSSAQVLAHNSHIRPARARRAAPCCLDPVTGTREATRGWNASHTHGHMDMHHAPQTFGDILPYSAYGPRPVTACSSVPRVCRLTTVCRAAATPDTLVAHLDVT